MKLHRVPYFIIITIIIALYLTPVRSKFEYASNVWNSTLCTNVYPLLRLLRVPYFIIIIIIIIITIIILNSS
jgi:hypothetical protein